MISTTTTISEPRIYLDLLSSSPTREVGLSIADRVKPDNPQSWKQPSIRLANQGRKNPYHSYQWQTSNAKNQVEWDATLQNGLVTSAEQVQDPSRMDLSTASAITVRVFWTVPDLEEDIKPFIRSEDIIDIRPLESLGKSLEEVMLTHTEIREHLEESLPFVKKGTCGLNDLKATSVVEIYNVPFVMVTINKHGEKAESIGLFRLRQYIWCCLPKENGKDTFDTGVKESNKDKTG